MSHLFWLDEEHLRRIRHRFPKPRGVKRADDRRVLSGIIHVIRKWPTMAGCADRVRASQDFVQPVCQMVSDRRVRPHLQGAGAARSGRRYNHDRQHPSESTPDGGKPVKLHTICDGRGRPLNFFLSAGQMSDAKGALALLSALPPATMLGDKGYDADWFRTALAERGIEACIPARRRRKCPAAHDTKLYRKAQIENLFGRLKDWWRIGTRYDRCGELFFSAICIAATLVFWL
jgi:transposase